MSVKRTVDVVAALLGIVLTSPVILVFMFLTWRQDHHSPLYRAPRVGLRGQSFRMVKLRSMVVDADMSGVDSTARDDPRITGIGRLVRKYKLDELTQLCNVLRGDMSLVGPRPQVRRDVDLYTEVEHGLLDVRPGITDFSSIVFADEGNILEGASDPDLLYNQIIRPWKSRLSLFGIETNTVLLDLELICATALALANRAAALTMVARMLRRLGAEDDLVKVATRAAPLTAAPPPGAIEIVRSCR